MSKEDGGPAFGLTRRSYGGMSLRDYFAASYVPPEEDVIKMCEIIFKQMPAGCTNWPMLCKRQAKSRLRYMEADAMLIERSR